MKNKNSISSIVIIILSLIIVGLIVYIVYDKLLNNENNQVNNTQNEIEDDNDEATIVQSENLLKEIKPVFEFVYDFFDTGNAYCGERGGYDDYIKGNKTPSNGFYGSKQFKTYQEMIDYLKMYMTEEIINKKNSIKKEFYIEQDGKLYCEDLGKGGNIYQRENIIIQINSLENNVINAIVAVELSTSDIYKDYKNYNVTFSKQNDNWIINLYEEQI